MARIQRTLELARASWLVLQQDRELLWLPVLSFLASIAVTVTFLIPVRVIGFLDTWWTFALAALYYFTLIYVTIFFNTAIVSAAVERMRGGNPTLSSAIEGAMDRAGQILPWALISATVSLVLRAVQERGGLIGWIVGSLAGVAWSLVTYLVIPVMVVEGVSAGDAIQRSSQLFKRTWGENVTGQIGFGLIGAVLAVPAILVLIVSFGQGAWMALPAIAVAVLWIGLVAVVMAALTAVFQTALYLYAAGEQAETGFSEMALAGAFPAKRR